MRHFTKIGRGLAAAAVAVTIALPANALTMFTFQRLSDTKVILSGIGSPDLGLIYPTGANDGTFRGLTFEGLLQNTAGPAFGSVEPVSGGTFGFGNPSGDPNLPNAGIPGWTVDSGSMFASVLQLFFDNATTPTGSDTLMVTGGTIAFLPVGTSGSVTTKYTPFTGGNPVDPVTIGTWEIVEPVVAPIPLPASLPLAAAAFGLLWAVSRRRRDIA